MNDKTITPETMPEENQQYCPKCGEEIVQCENCENTGCPDCDGFVVTSYDVLLCPECAASCENDCNKMRAVGCGSCSLFSEENDEGQGWCELHQEPVCFIDKCSDRISKV
jgi:hypothetical protein